MSADSNFSSRLKAAYESVKKISNGDEHSDTGGSDSEKARKKKQRAEKKKQREANRLFRRLSRQILHATPDKISAVESKVDVSGLSESRKTELLAQIKERKMQFEADTQSNEKQARHYRRLGRTWFIVFGFVLPIMSMNSDYVVFFWASLCWLGYLIWKFFKYRRLNDKGIYAWTDLFGSQIPINLLVLVLWLALFLIT
jgi:hypothetical protein